MRPPDWLRRAAPDPALAEAEVKRQQHAAQVLRDLRDARTRAGISYADVERDTRINRTYIQALEDGDFESLPAPVYARGFMRSYARYLGLDEEECVAAVPRDLPQPAGLEPMPGLRRTVTPVIPPINPPVVIAIAVAALLVLAAVIIVPRLGDPDGIGLPDATATATVAVGAPAATVPPFAAGEAPDFRGVPVAEAERLLATLDVTPLVVEAANEAPPDTVFEQSPAPGAQLRAGDVMTLFVSQ